MGLIRRLILSALLVFCLVSCASFAFKYYALDYDTAMLIGDKPENDLPLAACKGDDQKKRKCVLMFTDEFTKMVNHQIDVEKRLEACENPGK